MKEQSPVLVGTSEVIRALDQEVTLAARSDAKVLITGESGVGKDLVARLIHGRSRRASSPLITLNCAGVPESLLESELFGHVRGSFTGAYRDKPGLLEAAHGGTVFLDEIGEMSLRMQALLLRFLETGEVQRVGADRASTRLDVRVVCATNRVLADRIAAGEFREDLFYRLNVIHLHIPPLRERRSDLPEHIEYHLRAFAEHHALPMPRLDGPVLERLLDYDWPGNVRELRNVLERVVVRAYDGLVRVTDLPADLLRRSALSTRHSSDPAPSPAERLADLVARDVLSRMTDSGQTFWAAVHDPFVARDMTRDTLQRVVCLGLAQCGGDYMALTALFNMGRDEHKRLVTFLKKHECLVESGPFRPQRAPEDPVPTGRERVA
jgi:transcriptional regulator with PAS, ATPase and Fis domain